MSMKLLTWGNLELYFRNDQKGVVVLKMVNCRIIVDILQKYDKNMMGGNWHNDRA